MTVVDFTAIYDSNFKAVFSDEVYYCDLEDGFGLEALFESVPLERRDAALWIIFDVSVRRLSSVLLSFVIDRGLLGSPAFSDSLKIAFQLRDRFFSDTSPYMESGHFELLKSLAAPLGLDFTVNTMDAVYSPHLEKGKAPFDDTDRIEGYTENLKLAMKFCQAETLNDVLVGNTAIRKFSRFGENAIANSANIAAVEHIIELSKLNFDDLAAMLDVASADEVGRFPYITDQFLTSVFNSFQNGIKVFDKHALRPAFQYYPVSIIEHLEKIDDEAIGSVINSAFIDRYLNHNWLNLDGTHGFLLDDDSFLARLDGLNARIFSNPYIHSLLKDYSEGSITISKLLAYKHFESAGYHLKIADQRDCNPLAVQLIMASNRHNLFEFVEKGKNLIMDVWSTSAQTMYGEFWALVNDVKNPDEMSEAETIKAAFFLMAGDYAANVDRLKTKYPQFIRRDKPSADQVAKLFVITEDSDKVVDVIKNVPGYLRALVSNKLLDVNHLKKISIEELSEQFGQDLGL